LILGLFFLNSCVESTAFFGPAITVGTSGNVYQAGLSYGSNQLVKETTGKSTFEHMSDFIDSKKFKDTKKKIINRKNKLEETFENIEKKSMDFFVSVRSLYLQEKY
tara:strand:+ start:2414 stop:2731 length:318 start_codon:yes stop_codon:yes gene_type:complete